MKVLTFLHGCDNDVEGSNVGIDNIFAVKFIEKSMAVFLFLFPCFVSMWSVFKKFNMYKSEYGLPHNLVYWFFFCIVAAILLEAFILYKGKKINTLDIIQLCLIAFIIRILFAFLLNGKPEGDFFTYYDYASNPGKFRERMVPYFATYSFLIGIFMKLFNSESTIIGMIFNAFFTSLIPAILFYAVKKIVNEGAAYLAAVCYSFFPSMILYSVCFSGENISQFFMALLFLMFLCLWDAEKERNIKRVCVYFILSCLCAAFLNLFKPIFSLIILCVFVEELIYRIIPSIARAVKERKWVIMVRAIVVSGCTLILMMGVNKLIFNCSALVMENWYNTAKISESSYGPGNFAVIAYTGLKEEGGGAWNEEVNNQVTQIREQSENYDDASDKMLAIILNQIKSSPSNFLNFLLRKMRISWADEWAYSYYSCAPKEENTNLLSIPSSHFILYVVPLIYMNILYIGCMLEFLFGCLLKRSGVCRGEGTLYIFFGGFVLIFLILTAHERYKSTFMPLISIIAALGFYNFATRINAIVSHVFRRCK